MHIPGTPQFVHVPRSYVVVQFVLIDGLSHDEEILAQHCLARVKKRPHMLFVKHASRKSENRDRYNDRHSRNSDQKPPSESRFRNASYHEL
jgi:hypothetical protein